MELSPFFFGLYKFVKYGVYPMTWIVGCIAASLVMSWLPYSPGRQRWLRRLLGTSWVRQLPPRPG